MTDYHYYYHYYTSCELTYKENDLHCELKPPRIGRSSELHPSNL